MQRFDVLNPDLNVLAYKFLEASAGTGKTFAIETLFVRWILEGIEIQNILVVTFTKAATQELIERIHKRLQTTLIATEIPERRLLLEAALSTYDEAKIFTIHGFCQTMLRKFYLQSGCTLRFSDGSELNQGALWSEWIDFLRAHTVPNTLSTTQIAKFFGNDFEKNLRDLVRKWNPETIDLLPDFYKVPLLIEQRLQQIDSLPMSLVMEDLEQLQDIYVGFTGYLQQYSIIAKWCKTHSVTLEEIDLLLKQKEFFLTALKNAGQKKKQKNKSLHFPTLITQLQEVLLPLLADLIDQEKIGKKLCSQFTAYRKQFGKSSATPDELLISMKEAISKPLFLEAVRKQFSAVVIDEFQDTDQIQWMIFSHLFEKQRPLKAFYLVGDPKQSIYSFRSADLYTYLSAKESFLPHEIATLSVNFRSVKPLVDALNALFTDPQSQKLITLPKTGQVLEISRVDSANQEAKEQLLIGNIHIVISEKEEQLFAYIASQIQFWKNQHVLPNNIAILVKDRFEARRLISFLNQAKIKTHYRSQGHIADTPTFEALVDFFSLLEKPRDESRLRKVLLGPLLGWCQDQISHDTLGKALFGVQKLLQILEEKGVGPCLRAFFNDPWSSSQIVSIRLLHDDYLDLFEEFEQLFQLLIEKHQGEILPPRQIRLYCEILRKEKNKEGVVEEKRSTIDDDAVEITTIFQSKGLEYEIVFPLALATSEEKEDAEESKAEKMRLFYVALTRAKRFVYLPWMPSKDKSISTQFFSHWDPSHGVENIKKKLSELGHHHSITFETLQEILPIEAPKKDIVIPQIPLPQKFTHSYVQGSITSFSSMTKGQKDNQDIICSSDALPVGAETGKFMHALLEDLFRNSWHYPYQREKIVALISKKAQGTVFANLIDEVEQLLLQVIHLQLIPRKAEKPPFTLADVPRSSLMPELEFVYADKDDLIKGFIDLTFLHDGLYYIIDWKTNWLPDYSAIQIDASVEKNRYDLQAKIYTEALKRYVKLFDTRSFEECFGGAHYLFLRGLQWKSFLN